MPPGVVYEDHLRIQSVIQLKTGLPEDRIVNTWHFRNDSLVGTWQESIDIIVDGLIEFYGTPAGEPAAYAIKSFMAGTLIDSWEFRGYDLGQPEPREPHIVDGVELLTGIGVATPMPTEVAAVLSLGTAVIAPKAGTPGKRGKGRLYLGPLSTSVLDHSGTTNLPRVDPGLRSACLAAYQRLAAYSGFTPVVLSPTYQQTDVVTKVWMDDAFDTQRRRGNAPTTRETVTL